MKAIEKELADIPEYLEYKDFLDAARTGDAARLLEANVRLEPDSDIKDENGDSPALLAAKAGSLPCLRYLKNAEFNIYDANSHHENILNISIPKATTPDMVNFIIHSTANTANLTLLAAPDKDGNTPLHIAAANTKVDFMPLFLKYLDMISPDSKNNAGLTALDIAVKNDNFSAVQTLLKRHPLISEQTFQLASPKMLELLNSIGKQQ